MTKANLTNESIKWGIIAGLLFSLIQITSWTLGIKKYVSVVGIETFTPYIIIIFLIAGLSIRKRNGGFLSFQEGLKFVFLAYVIVVVIEGINNYILYNILDKDLTAKVIEEGKEKMIKMMQKFGAPQEKIDEAMKSANSERKQTDLKNILLGTGMSLIWYFVKSLLITLVIKKEQKLDETYLSQ